MFGIGMPEMILILAVALIVIGPKKLPDLAKSLGKAMGEFKKATSDLKESMQVDTELNDVKTAFTDINKSPEKEAAQAAGDMQAQPADVAMPGETPDTGNTIDGDADSMDKLKAAFDRRHTDASDSDAGRPAERDVSASDVDPDSETPRNKQRG